MVSSLISEEMSIAGNLTSDGTIFLAGRIKGDVSAAKVEISLTGRLEGSVTADQLVVSGHFIGNASCSSVLIFSDATVESHVTATKLACEAGAKISGKIDVGGGQVLAWMR